MGNRNNRVSSNSRFEMPTTYMKAVLFCQVLPDRKLLKSDRMGVVPESEWRSDMLCLNAAGIR